MVSSMVAVAVEVVPTKDEVTVVTETEVLVTTLTGKVWVVVDVTTPDVLVVVRKHAEVKRVSEESFWPLATWRTHSSLTGLPACLQSDV